MAKVEKTGHGEQDTVISLDGSSEAGIVAVTGGGGGVGKSTFVAHAAAALAKSGQKVLVIDQNSGSFGAGNLLGMNGNAASLSGLLSSSKKLPPPDTETGVANVSFASGDGHGVGRYGKKIKNGDLFAKLRGLKFNTIILDLGLITDRVKENLFVQSDCRIVVSAPSAQSVENLGRMLPGLVVSCFENSAKWETGARKAANALRELLYENRSIGTAEIETYFETAYPDLLEKWRSASEKFNVSLVMNRLNPGNQLQEARNEMQNLAAALPDCNIKPYFLPTCEPDAENLLSGSAVAGGFVNAAGRVIQDILGLRSLNRRQEDEIFIDTYYGTSGVVSNDERPRTETGVSHGDIGNERLRRMDQLEEELEFVRSEKYESMRRLLDRSIAERRNEAFAQLEGKMRRSGEEMEEKLRREGDERSARIQKEVKLRKAELLAQAASEAQQKSDNMGLDAERHSKLRMREIDEELEGYYKDRKLAFDREMSQRRKRMESEISEEVLMKKKKDRTRMELELTAEVDKVREMIWQQLEEKRLSKLNQVDDSIEQYRQDRKKEVELECQQKREFIESRIHKETELKKENLMLEVFRDVMEISALYDSEEHNRTERLVGKLRSKISVEKEVRLKRLHEEVAGIREEKEKEVFAEMQKQREARSAVFESEMGHLRAQMKAEVIAEAEESKRKLLDDVTQYINDRRLELLSALEREKQKRTFDLKRQEMKELAEKQVEVREKIEAMENSLQADMRQRVLSEQTRLSRLAELSFVEKKKETEKTLAKIVNEERESRIRELNEELTHHREVMMEGIANEIRLVREQHMEKQRVELAGLRKQKLQHLDKDIHEEIRRKTKSASRSMRDVEVSIRAEMQERLSQEEVRLRKVLNANLEIEMNDLRRKLKNKLHDDEMRLKMNMKRYVDEEKKKQVENFDRDMSLRKSKHEESLNEWKEREKVHLMRDVIATLGEEEQVHRDLMASRLEYERKRMGDELSIIRKRAEGVEQKKLQNWIIRKKEEAVTKIRTLVKEEHQKRVAELQDAIAEERQRRQVELSTEMAIENERRLRQLDTEMQKTKMSLAVGLESEMRELRRRKTTEMEQYTREEEKRMEERLDRKYRELVKKKEEWLEYETKRRMLEQSESIEKEINVEKDKRLEKRLIELEVEMVARRRKSKAAVEEEKARMFVSLRDEIGTRRKKMIRKMSVHINEKLSQRRKEIEKDIERHRISRAKIIDMKFRKTHKTKLTELESELDIERERRLELMDAKLKAEEYEKRQKIIDEIMKKKEELDRLFDLERRKYFERLQNELLNNKQASPQYLEQEIDRLNKTWRLN